MEHQPVRSAEHPAAALSGARRYRRVSSRSKFRALGLGLLVLLVAAAGWSTRIDQGLSVQHLDEAASHAPSSPPNEQTNSKPALKIPEQPASATSSSADPAQVKALQMINKLPETEIEAAKSNEKNQLEQARLELEMRAKRAAETKRAAEARRRSDEMAQRQVAAGEAQRKRDADERVKRDEAQRRRQQPVAVAPAAISPQQACAGSSNFISRGLCEARECSKPQSATLPYCVDMKERLKPRTAA